MNGTTIFAFFVMICMYMSLVPLSEETGNANLHGVSVIVGQISGWIFWTYIIAGIEYNVRRIKALYKEF
jgi:hypothetical protein